MLPIVIIGIALFIMAFIGINKLLPTIFGLASVVGIIFGLYFVWLGISGNSSYLFGWGCVLVVGAGGILIYLKTAHGD